jgi:hypothetical protein
MRALSPKHPIPGECMRSCRSEPTLAELLNDPVVRAVMAADGVEPRALEAALREMARGLGIGGQKSKIRNQESDGLIACL